MDDEIKGEGNSLNYEYRMHDPRIGRFFATDPLESQYPHYSPYQFSGNRPIDCVELEGLEPAKYQSELTGAIEVNDYSQNGDGFPGVHLGGQYDGKGDYWNFIGMEDPNQSVPTEMHTITDDPWDNNYGSLYDQNGWPLQEGYDPLKGYSFDGNAFIKSFGHGALQGIGMIPGFGEPFNLLDAAWYASDGEYLNAGFALGEAVPFAGWLATGAKWTYKGGKILTKSAGVVPMGLVDDVAKNADVISAGDYRRIQNAATRIKKPIHVVGSRASGKAGPYSDWDYIIDGGLNSKQWDKIKNSLPGSKSILDNTPRNIDILPGPVLKEFPYITIHPTL